MNQIPEVYFDFANAEPNIILPPNAPPEDKQKISDLVAQTLQKITQRSFFGRNPNLGKMFKCQVCSRRHRGEPCKQKIIRSCGETVKGIVGAQAFHKKRHHPHPNKIGLLLLERTRKIFDELDFTTECSQEEFQANLRQSRILASRQLRKERRIRLNRRFKEQIKSRKINRC